MHVIESAQLAPEDVSAVSAALNEVQDSPLAAQLQAIVSQLGNGTSLTLLAKSEQLTPNRVADMLQMSRPMVLALIERGELSATIVGNRDRRIPASEVLDFIARRDRASRDVAASLANRDKARSALIARGAGVSPELAAELGY